MLKNIFKKIDHIVLTTENVDSCLSFYESLGFIVSSGNGSSEIWADDFKINVHTLGKELLPHAKNVQVGSADLCFEITCNIEEYKTYLENKGIEIEEGVVYRNGARGSMKSIYIRDVDGNLLEFSQYEQ